MKIIIDPKEVKLTTVCFSPTNTVGNPVLINYSVLFPVSVPFQMPVEEKIKSSIKGSCSVCMFSGTANVFRNSEPLGSFTPQGFCSSYSRLGTL